MKNNFKNHIFPTAPFSLKSFALAASLCLPLPALAASVALTTAPMATSTTTVVKPNLTFLIDNSGSMDWDHMPDDATDGGSAVTWSYGYYGLRSSHCNQVYYDPAVTYGAPIKADGTYYADATFASARQNGFNAGSTAVNLNTGFTASASLNPDTQAQSAYYYGYSGAQTTQLQRNYNSITNAFYAECHDSTGSNVANIAPVNGVKALTGGAPATAGSGVFTKHRLAATSTTTITISGSASVATPVTGITVNLVQLLNASTAGSTTASTVASNIAAQINAKTATSGFSATATGSTVTITGPTSSADYTPVISYAGTFVLTADVFPDTTATKLTNFANWYSFYRTRMLMMKTAAGMAFSKIDNNYRVGLMKISSSTPVVLMDTFWNNNNAGLGAISTHKSDWYTALYGLSVSGSTPLRQALSNAGLYYAHKLSGVADPMQYSCQQNFTIMSTDGYWNTGSGFQLDGSTAVGNQDGTADRPMKDDSQAGTTVTTTYSRNSYSKVSGSCSGNQRQLKTQAQTGTCSVTTVGGVAGAESCNWVNNGSATYGSCASNNSVTVPSPNPSTRVQVGSAITTSGASGGSSDSLSDVAMYYYKTDLRNSSLSNCTGSLGNDVCTDNVFISGTDSQNQQHMTTFTLGLGASGWMNYSSTYLADSTGDYVAVKLGSTANSSATPPVCSWQADNTVCNWPAPGMSGSDGLIANIDDLWHAAVNGRGAYFSATSPKTLSDGLNNALVGIKARKGAAAAASTSTLNPVSGNNSAFVASYTTSDWTGNLESRGINTDTGVVNVNAAWCVEDVAPGICNSPSTVVTGITGAVSNGNTSTTYCKTPNAVTCPGGLLNVENSIGYCYIRVATACTGTLKTMALDTTDTRTILTASDAGTSLVNFDSTYGTNHATYFDAAHIGNLTQWPTFTTTALQTAVSANLVNYLRGQTSHDQSASLAVDQFYRTRKATLGDALESQPTYISNPTFSYPYSGYAGFATAQAGRAGTVYMGTNDGMMHAFDSSTGVERWAYVPSMVIPNMWKLADLDYSNTGYHRNFINGSPITTDICTANCSNGSAVWKTILVGGLNGGGRGYYALDITNPASPSLLWEFKPAASATDSGSYCTTHYCDANLGYSFGQPVVTQKNDGTWVVLVTSGYNNGTDSAEPATINGNTFIANSPAGDGKGYLYVLNAGTGTLISKISTTLGSAASPSGLARITAWNNEPAGNKAGYVYGGDLLGNLWRFDINANTVMKFAALYSNTGGTIPQPITTTPVLGLIGGKRVVFIGTGKYLENSDLSNTDVQSEYAIKDDDATTTLINPRVHTSGADLMVNQTLTNVSGTNTRTVTSNTVDFSTGRGWYVDFPDSKERVNISARLVMGTLIVPTIVPVNSDCSPGGYGWLNYFDYATGGATDPNGGGVAGVKYDSTIVGTNVIYIDGKPKVSVVTSDNQTPENNDLIAFHGSPSGFANKRSLWRELIP